MLQPYPNLASEQRCPVLASEVSQKLVSTSCSYMVTIMSNLTLISSIESSLSLIETFSERHAHDLVKEYVSRGEPLNWTSKVLFAFFDYLPSDSVVVVADDIINYSGKLHELADHYVLTVFFPSKF